MERKGVIVTVIFGTIGSLAVLAMLSLAAWLYLRAKKLKQRRNNFEPRDRRGDNSICDDREEGKSTNRKDGFLNLKTPLISMKVFRSEFTYTHCYGGYRQHQ